MNRNIFERGWFTKTTFGTVIVLVVSQSIWELQLVTRNMQDDHLCRFREISFRLEWL